MLGPVLTNLSIEGPDVVDVEDDVGVDVAAGSN